MTLKVAHHFYCAGWTLAHADATTFAVVQIDFKTEARAKLFDRVVRADTKAVVTFEAVAAGHATTSFVERGGFIKALDDFAEVIHATRCG